MGALGLAVLALPGPSLAGAGGIVVRRAGPVALFALVRTG